MTTVAAARLLRFGVAAQCLAQGAKHLFSDTAINGWLTNHGTLLGAWCDPMAVARIDRAAGLALVAVAGLLLGRAWKVALPLVAAWFLLNALAGTLPHLDDPYLRLGVAAQAVRWLSPVALLLLAFERPWTRTALWLLILGTAATFVAHGLKDIWLHPQYIDLIRSSAMRAGLGDAPWAERALRGIGIADLLAAAVLIAMRWRAVAFAMGIWGLVAAGSRMTAGGWEQWPETLLRTNNGLAPLAVALLLWALARNPAEAK